MSPRSAELDQAALSELSRHYDSALWTVTSLWAAIVGGMLLYVKEHPDLWLTLFGMVLTVLGMFFAETFRRMRRQVHARMTEEVQALHVSPAWFRQWEAFALIFLGLVVLWTRLLIDQSTPVWLACLIGVVSGGVIVWRWGVERRGT